MASKFRIPGTLLLLAAQGPAAEIIIQPQFTGSADYGSHNGQSFLVPSGTTLRAIQLHIASRGGSLQIRLWKTARVNGQLTRSGTLPLASGTLDKSAIIGNTPGWFEIPFTTPYSAAGTTTEELAFDVLNLTSGTNGYNNYSFSTTTPYLNGTRVSLSESTSIFTPYPTTDLTFKIIGDPPAPTYRPRVTFTPPPSFAPGQSFTYQLEATLANRPHTLRKSETLDTPILQWSPIATQSSTGDRLTWTLPYDPAVPRSFFAITID